MKLAIQGSRTLFGPRVKETIIAAMEWHGATMLVTSGETSGVCKEACSLARELAIPLELHWLNNKYRLGMFEHRSKAILLSADHILLIHDGSSKGTANELALCQKLKKPHTYCRLDASSSEDDVAQRLEEILVRGALALQEVG